MSVTVTKTSGGSAEITWQRRGDDPHGYLVRSVESEQLAYALESLGASEAGHTEPTATEEYALQAVKHTAELGRLLERRAAVQVVQLHDHYGLSWRKIAAAIYDDPEKQSSVRRMYDSGRRHIGV
ncbi:hypothetical protein [Streptomyces mirabilis]|uniref:hypothetical protein n=1 Tax=Streptomyces mirabilis TaxID=68239 RepID=UPI00339E9BDD